MGKPKRRAVVLEGVTPAGRATVGIEADPAFSDKEIVEGWRADLAQQGRLGAVEIVSTSTAKLHLRFRAFGQEPAPGGTARQARRIIVERPGADQVIEIEDSKASRTDADAVAACTRSTPCF